MTSIRILWIISWNARPLDGNFKKSKGIMVIYLIDPPIIMARDYPSRYKLPSLALGYLAACAAGAGHKVRVIDAAIEGWKKISVFGKLLVRGLTPEDIVAGIRETPDVVGITVLFSAQWPLVIDLCSRLRRRFKDALIVLGGEHPTAMPGLCLTTSRADLVVLGEGEETFLELLAAVQKGSKRDWYGLKGIGFLDGNKVTVTAPRQRMKNLDVLPLPAWEHFDLEAYRKQGLFGASARNDSICLPILASRGCPFSCKYYSAPNMWRRQVVERNPASVVDEMVRDYDKFHARYFVFCDLSFGLNNTWLAAFCADLEKRGLTLEWEVVTRPEVFCDERAQLMKRAGLKFAGLGFESGSSSLRCRVGRRGAVSTALKALRACHKAGVLTRVQLQVGFPGETSLDELKNLIFAARAAKVGATMLGPTIFVPYPGTKIFEELVHSGKLRVDDQFFEFAARSNGLLPSGFRFAGVRPTKVKALQYLLLATFVCSRLFWRPKETLMDLLGRSGTGYGHLSEMLERIFAFLKRENPLGTVIWPEVDWVAAMNAELGVTRDRFKCLGHKHDDQKLNMSLNSDKTRSSDTSAMFVWIYKMLRRKDVT